MNLSFNAIWEEYCTDASFCGNTPNTQKHKWYSFGRYCEFFSKRKKSNVTEITKQDVRAFQASRQHFRVASNRDLSHMSHFFQFALGEGYIPHNPVTWIKKEWEAPGFDGIKLEQLNDFFIFLKNHPKDFDHETRTYRTNPDGSDYLDPHRLTEANFAKKNNVQTFGFALLMTSSIIMSIIMMNVLRRSLDYQNTSIPPKTPTQQNNDEEPKPPSGPSL